MIKEKIDKIIYSDDYTDVELERYFHYDKYEGYILKWDCELYNDRVYDLALDIYNDGASYVLDLPIEEHKNNLQIAILKYLKYFDIDKTTEKLINKLLTKLGA